MKDRKFRFVVVEITTGGRHGTAEVLGQQVYDTTHTTLIKARDELIRRARAEHVKDFWVPGEAQGSVSEEIYKFEFKNQLVGYYHYDTGLSFLFREDSPVYDPIVTGKIKGQELAERLLDLYDFYREARREAREPA